MGILLKLLRMRAPMMRASEGTNWIDPFAAQCPPVDPEKKLAEDLTAQINTVISAVRQQIPFQADDLDSLITLVRTAEDKKLKFPAQGFEDLLRAFGIDTHMGLTWQIIRQKLETVLVRRKEHTPVEEDYFGAPD